MLKTSNKNIIIINASKIQDFVGLESQLQSMLAYDECKNTALQKSCHGDKCSLLLYSKTGFKSSNEKVGGFITMTSVKKQDETIIDEIYNLCSATPRITKDLLKIAVSMSKAKAFWIGMPINAPQWEKYLKIFAKLGFKNPVITNTSPSGYSLNYEYMAFLRTSNKVPTEGSIESTIETAERLKLRYARGPLVAAEGINVIVPPFNEKAKRFNRKGGDDIFVPDTCLSGYALERYINEGTYGVVYGACDIEGNCDYILKVQNLANDGAQKEWENEVKLTQALNKNGIGSKMARAWICDEDDQRLGIFASEKWDGDLQGGECPPLNIIEKIEDQIDALHKMGLVHGDILPKNILVKRDKDGNITDATISDFGTVDTVEQWKFKQHDHEWIKTFYDYHHHPGAPYMALYYDEENVSLNKVINDPAHLDMPLMFYFRTRCTDDERY